MTSPAVLRQQQQKIWQGCIPLEIRLAKEECKTYDYSEPYLVLYPRLSYLPLLLPKLHAFFRTHLINDKTKLSDGWFQYENVPLRWQYAAGLLFDIYSGFSDRLDDSKKNSPVEPDTSDEQPKTWQITVHFDNWPTEELVKPDDLVVAMKDAFTNSYKAASFVRFMSTKVVNRLSKDDALGYWDAVVSHDFAQFQPISQKLTHPRDVETKNLPIKIYLPSSASDDDEDTKAPGHLNMIQGLVPAMISPRKPQTLGTALNLLLPSLFPSRRSPIFAQPVLHGAIVPLGVALEALSDVAAYADGYLHFAVTMMQ